MQGVVTRKQALAAGRSAKQVRGLLARRQWQVMHRGVYLTHSGPIVWQERVAAAVLAAGPGAVASEECALPLWGLSDRRPPVITVAIPAARTLRADLRGVRVRRRRRLTRAVRSGIPVSGLHQSVLDVLALPRTDDDEMVALLLRACRPGRSSPAVLRAELAHHPSHPRRAELETVLEAAELGLGSVAEWRYVRDVERPHGLPTMTPQVAVAPSGELVGTRGATPTEGLQYLDLLDPERGVGVEIDGALFHADREHLDRARDRNGLVQGRAMLRAGWSDVVLHPCELAVEVALVQRRHGWDGRPGPCSPSCAFTTDARLVSP
ncbi:hypothetical protein [uncultured Serinicoccus sp.]|uniref:hypothetical protein n=1 Tax=uncultured Serinicoccus sp. TaxID=735514 RepID=UPI002603B67D|nr:hypothetical protein [uncultured Serinicoccus sp.]